MDRLVTAGAALADQHEVFVQSGPSQLAIGCPHARFIGFEDVRRRIAEADVVITHAGNTVRLAQAAGKVPIVVARDPGRGEAGNDHQQAYTRSPEALGPAVVLGGDLTGLREAVDRHGEVAARLREGGPHPRGDAARAVAVLDAVLGPGGEVGRDGEEEGNPFRHDAVRRYAWAWDRLAERSGRHLDLGIGDGAPFAAALHRDSMLDVVAVDAHAGYLRGARARDPKLALVRVEGRGRLPFPDGCFDSVSALDVLEHVADEERTLSELARVTRPGGLLVLTVPARHLFSGLDPDNAKLRHPRLHRAVAARRYGHDGYRERFLDLGDGLRGDMASNRDEHTNYRAAELIERVSRCGFIPRWRGGANLFGRVLDPVRALSGGRVSRVVTPLILKDGLVFDRANLFLSFEREQGPMTGRAWREMAR